MKIAKFICRVLVFLIMFCFIFSSVVFADTYSANAGIATSVGLKNNNNGALSSGNLVQYIHLKQSDIFGPVDVNGSVNAGFEDVRPAIFPENNDRQVGYDSTLANKIQPEPTAGKFWHQVNVSAGTKQPFIVRAWDAQDPAQATYFGESIVFYSQQNPAMPPSNTELQSFSTIFPKQAPIKPSPNSSAIQGHDAVAPKLVVSFSPVLGARYFEVEVYRERTQDGQGNYVYNDLIADSMQYKDSLHSLYIGNEAAIGKTFDLTLNDQDKTIYYRVRAANSFGNSDWFDGKQIIPKNLDTSIPYPITNLQSAYDKNSNIITLSWAAPYDNNNTGVISPCDAYDIRVSLSSIIDKPVSPLSKTQTNPQDESNWDTAVSIIGYPDFSFAPNFNIPSPKAFGETEEIQMSGNLSGVYFFAIKSRDDNQENGEWNHWSYVSNIAGAVVSEEQDQPSTEFEMTYSLEKPSTGINTIAIPFKLSQPIVHDAGVSNGAVIDLDSNGLTVLELITAINIQAGENIVTVFGWYDAGEQEHVGLTSITYTDQGAIQGTVTGAGSVSEILNTLIIQAQPYQVSVNKAAIFKLKGY